MTDKKISVLIVDDSASARELLAYIINKSSNLEVAGFAENGEQALQFLKSKRVDVVTMDIVMPKMNGFETTRAIMETSPVPIIVISGNINPEDVNNSFKAIDAGCVAILAKPRGPGDPLFPLISKSIIETITNMADVKLVTRRRKPIIPPRKIEPIHSQIQAIAIGASLGGPQALQSILSKLKPSFPVPIFIVQHISSGFIKGFTDWLNEATQLNVILGEEGYLAKPGDVVVAPDRYHMEVIKNNQVHLVKPEKEETLYPSVSRLFESMAKTHGKKGMGVILTGMGRDGAKELLLMKQNGATTIAQDENGCIMFGMPKAAIELNAASHIIPLDNLADTLQRLISTIHLAT